MMITFLIHWHILVLNASVCCEKSLSLSLTTLKRQKWDLAARAHLAWQHSGEWIRSGIPAGVCVPLGLTRQQCEAPRLNCDRLSQGSWRPNLAAIMPTTFIWKWAVLTRALIIWKSLLPSNDRRQTSAQTFKK